MLGKARRQLTSMLQLFIAKWTHPDYSPEIISIERLQNVEKQFDFQYPADYRNAVLQFGLPRPTLALLDAIVERDISVHCVSDFLNPEDAVEQTIGWREIGLPHSFVAFASDEAGNLFCFDTAELFSQNTDRSAVWFYDHDFNEAEVVSPSFTAWIEVYSNIEPVTELE
jgi:hypothetical protein